MDEERRRSEQMSSDKKSAQNRLAFMRISPSAPQNSAGSPAPRLSPVDVSTARSLFRYAVFVCVMASIASVCLLAVPAILVLFASNCDSLGRCLSLEKDLLRSLNNSMHPCDDFYQHVCSGWDDPTAGHRQTPSMRYHRYFKDDFLWDMLRRTVPVRPRTAVDKVSFMLLSCLKQIGHDGRDELKDFLQDVGLPWPHKSRATREHLLQTLVKLSLELGMPTFWTFLIGRHPAQPTRNTLYMTMDRRLLEWSRDVDELQAHGTLHQYIRRCAEVLGGTGQSYSSMIADVLQAHENISDIVAEHWQLFNIPRYNNLSDAELRRAINSQLPDDSQLWPEDEIVNLQPSLFEVLDRFHLRPEGDRERFKLFLGAYLVWTVAPLVTSRLATAMMGDMGHNSHVSFMSRQCFSSVSFLLPLVSWKLQSNTARTKALLWAVFRAVTEALLKAVYSYNEGVGIKASQVAARLRINAFNMSATWAMVDSVYAYLHLGGPRSGSYFKMFRHASRDTVSLYKQSLRKPRHTMNYIPGVAREPIYRLLVTRDVTVPNYWTALFLTGPTYPLPVLTAVLGTHQVSQMLALFNFIFFYDEQFMPYQAEQLGEFSTWLEHLDKYESVLRMHSYLPELTISERRHLIRLSVSAMAGAYASEAADVPMFGLAPDSDPAQHKGGLGSKTTFLSGVSKERQFFLISCFLECGLNGRQRLLQQTYCNVALPAVRTFSSAFGCTPNHLLWRNFTWLKFD